MWSNKTLNAIGIKKKFSVTENTESNYLKVVWKVDLLWYRLDMWYIPETWKFYQMREEMEKKGIL